MLGNEISRAERPTHLVVSSSTAARLEAARRWLGAMPRDTEVLVLAPHAHAADELVRAVVTESGSRFGVQRLTPNRLAARLAAPELARRGIASGTSLSLAAVATRAIFSALEEPGVNRFAAIARRPGFPHALVGTFEDLRAAGLAASDLREGVRRDTDLAVLFENLEQELERQKIADRAEVFEVAIGVLSSGQASLANLPVVLLDLPLEVEFERRLTWMIVQRAPAVFATAAEGDRVSIDALEAMVGASPTRLPTDGGVRSLTRLQRHLFEESAPNPQPLDESVSVASWPGELRECIEIARRMQTEAAKGVPFDRMAILLRAPGAYRAQVAEALRRAGIPAWFARGTTRPDPSGRALLALLACAAEGLSARRFAEYLSLAQVPRAAEVGARPWAAPEHDLMPTTAPEVDENPNTQSEPVAAPDGRTLDETPRAPWRWERLITDAAVIGGQDRWQRRLDGLAQEIAVRRGELEEGDARTEALDRTAQNLSHLRDFALPLIERLAALPREASWQEWLSQLRALVAVAMREPSGVLSLLGELEPLGPVGPVDLWMVQHVLGPRLRDLTVMPETRPNGAVFVAPVEMARGLEFDAVFVPGLAEKVFPQRILQDPLLPDEVRSSLGAAGLATQESRVAAERLALRLAAGAAKHHLSLSWPRIEIESARPRLPSFYALEAMRAAEGRLPGFDELTHRAETGARARLGWPAPEQPEEAIDDTEYDLAVLARLKEADPDTSVGAAAYLLTANVHLGRALRARARRWLKRWTPADGLVDPDPETLEVLAHHRIGARVFSPTALESFSVCPYRFLLQTIHALKPREEIEALESIDPLTRGALIHAVQFQVLSVLRDTGCLPLGPERLESAFVALDDAVARVAGEYRERHAPAIARVWEDSVNAMRFDLREWLRRLSEEPDGWVPYRFELTFGLPAHWRPTTDPASVTEAITVLSGARLRGSIDLVERRADGALRVTDHKTGKARVPEGAVVWGGQALQSVLYGLSAEVLLGSAVESGGLYYCTADGDFTERRIRLDELSRGHATTALNVIDHAIEQGFLPAAPQKDACRSCNYRMVCGPQEEYRTGRKPTVRLAELNALRDLP
jgi:RecB family exonuclease